jgi:hypothetical protein
MSTLIYLRSKLIVVFLDESQLVLVGEEIRVHAFLEFCLLEYFPVSSRNLILKEVVIRVFTVK